MNRSLDINGKQSLTYAQKENIQAYNHSNTVNWSKSTWFSSLLKQSKDDAATTELGKAFQMSVTKEIILGINTGMMFIQFILVSSRMSWNKKS